MQTQGPLSIRFFDNSVQFFFTKMKRVNLQSTTKMAGVRNPHFLHI